MRILSRTKEVLHDPHFTTAFHKYAVFVWLLLMIPSLIWWKESLPWLVFMSVWANVGAHWSAYQGSRSEKNQNQS